MSKRRAEEPAGKAALKRQMEETRDSISETVAEIKSVVTHQYDEVRETVESVKEGVSEVLDWRTEFERNPLVWGAGAVSVGILVGFGIARAFDEKEEPRPRGRRKTVTTGEHVVAELSGFAEVVLPTISSKVKELFGLDLDAYLRAAHTPRTPEPKRLAKKGASKKGASKKSASKKSAAASKAAARKRG
ncbi:MAG: hypothetical protein LC795_13065 [Acidobacteria bacterium]|nr:hypothetical protein [Acidobacteriota bacterium]